MARTIWPMVYRRTLTSNVWRPIGGYEWTEPVPPPPALCPRVWFRDFEYREMHDILSIISVIENDTANRDVSILKGKISVYTNIYRGSVQSVYTCVDIETDVKHSFRCKYRSSTLFCRICKLQALRRFTVLINIRKVISFHLGRDTLSLRRRLYTSLLLCIFD